MYFKKKFIMSLYHSDTCIDKKNCISIIYIYIYIYIYLVKVANLAVECSMPYKQNVV